MEYRALTLEEIGQLQRQSCKAEDWSSVTVANGFRTENIDCVSFSGKVCLGVFEREFTMPGGVKRHSGLHNVALHNVTVGNNCYIEHVHNYIANYVIGDNALIINVDVLYVEGLSRF